MPVTAIVLALDETLWHFPVPPPPEALHARAARQLSPLLAAWGRTDVDAGALSRRLLAHVEEAMKQAAAGSLLSPDFTETVEGAATDSGLDLDGEQLAVLWEAWQVDGGGVGRQLYPDARTTLAWARDAGYRLGLVANGWTGGEALARELAASGLGPYLDAVTVSADAGWLKPHPAIFNEVLTRLGVEPENAVMVGASLNADIAGAKLLGMRAVWKRNGKRAAPPPGRTVEPDAVIDDLWELRRLPFLEREGGTLVSSPTPHERFTG